MPGGWGHLAARFLDVVTSRQLTAAERSEVKAWLDTPAEVDAFFAQQPADQRHGHSAARVVSQEAADRRDLIRAALLHDVGKRHSRLSPVARAVASVAIRLGLPLTPRWALYRDHGLLTAAELAGAEDLVVEFARHHHGARPGSISADDWNLLVRADSARLGH